MNYSTETTMSGADSFSSMKNHQQQQLGFSGDGSGMYRPISAPSPAYLGSNGNGADGLAPVGFGSGEPIMKKKRGRPRKYGPDGSMALALTTAPQSVSGGGGADFSASPPPPAAAASSGPVSPNSSKKGRGRPPGSSTKKQHIEAMGSAGFGFTPHVITIKAGEDVSSKIMAFSQNGPRAVCILSANGAISNVTLRQSDTSGGTVTYEGRFEILSLRGSFLLSEFAGQRSRAGGLSISLSGPDGRVLGGGVAGLLTAASPVQVIVGSFVTGRKEAKPSDQMEPLTKVGQNSGAAGASSPPSRGTLSESSGGAGSPINQSTGGCNNSNPQGISSMPWK